MTCPKFGPDHRIYLEEDIQAIGGTHALERTLENESYWFVYLGQIKVLREASGFVFKDSDISNLGVPPERTWKIGRRNPVFGKPKLDRYLFRAAFDAIEQRLSLWKQKMKE